jgi:ferredoxin-thioredoxin reductase catalytic chain
MENSEKTAISKEMIEALEKEYKLYSKKEGFKLNSNKNVVETVIRRILENRQNLGHGYCPCRRTTGNKKEDEKIICPCIYHKDEIKKDEHCHCMLFVK